MQTEAELEELHECSIDLSNRLNAAEARETELASELANRNQDAEQLEMQVEALKGACSRIKENAATQIADLGQQLAQAKAEVVNKARQAEQLQTVIEQLTAASSQQAASTAVEVMELRRQLHAAQSGEAGLRNEVATLRLQLTDEHEAAQACLATTQELTAALDTTRAEMAQMGKSHSAKLMQSKAKLAQAVTLNINLLVNVGRTHLKGTSWTSRCR